MSDSEGMQRRPAAHAPDGADVLSLPGAAADGRAALARMEGPCARLAASRGVVTTAAGGATVDAAQVAMLERAWLDARRAGLGVEQVIIHLKAAWRAAADAADGRSLDSEQRLAQLVTRCIATYYEAR